MTQFLKMNGAGNDFVIFDARQQPVSLTSSQILQLADRQNALTKGCDQVIVMEPSAKADVFMRIYNADGSEVGSCGNASRCVAWLVGKPESSIETLAGIIEAKVKDEQHITIDMGEPRFSWRDIPLTSDEDTLHLPIGMGSLKNPAAVSMGNPHMIFFVSNAGVVALEELGPKLEHHPLFPERANVNVAQVDAKDKITLRVWERGAGITLACGTGACATLVAAHRRGYTDRKATVTLPGGALIIEWADNNHVLMTGPVVTSFEGKLD